MRNKNYKNPVETLIDKHGSQKEVLRQYEARTGHRLQEGQIISYKRGSHPSPKVMKRLDEAFPGFAIDFTRWFNRQLDKKEE